ncbi:MAG: anti-phage ZorAB system protein ZorA, partial [Pseudomonadota bacterium]
MSDTVGNKIDLTGLLPQLDSITFIPQTSDELSTIFVIILVLIFVGFILVSLYALFTSLVRISWVFKLLKGETSSSIGLNRQQLIEKATQIKHHRGHLWLDFDETLIEVERHDGIKLYNTVDANHFFNTSTLAAGITESRMLAAVPGFLTAFGVIGTFVGLQLGLSELNIGNDIAVSEMKTGVAHVISGAKIAFMTSVWGVTLSVLFNFLEKGFERIARSRIHRLQNKIDRLFPRLTAEFQLQRIANDGQQSRENLQGLAEKIGEKMQESLLEATSGIQAGLEASLKSIMAPAINKLVNETTDGNQKALENLINTFLNKIGKFGESQGEALEDAAQQINDALGSFNSIMMDYAAKMEASQNNSANREQQLIKTISQEVSLLVDHSTEQKQVLTEFVEKQLGGLTATLTGGIHGKEANPNLPEQPDEIVAQGIAAWRAMGGAMTLPGFLASLAQACGKV